MAVHVLVIEYDPAQAPVVVTSSKVNVTVPQESVAVACSKAGESGQFIVVSPGNEANTGGVVSTMVMVIVAASQFVKFDVSQIE